jgi:lipoyl synthase
MRSKALHTVCEQALCPNMAECWQNGTATFLILGNVCTRRCGFCAVRSGQPSGSSAEDDQALRVAEAVLAMGLRHVVVTSVTRDDLPDGGASVFVRTIQALRGAAPGCTVEVLIPDFQGDAEALGLVMDACPDVLGHNLETVPRLYPRVRPQADYGRSLELLVRARQQYPAGLLKSGVMVGFGEDEEELAVVFQDLAKVGCDILTIGQYLRPSRRHLPVVRYYRPEEFDYLKKVALDSGLRWVVDGPLVRSSYRAEEQVRELQRDAST